MLVGKVEKKLIWSMDDSIIDEYPSDHARNRQIGFASTPNNEIVPSMNKGQEYRMQSKHGYKIVGPHM